MKPFAEKPTDNLAGLYFILYQVRGASGGASHNSIQFAEVNHRIQCLPKSTFSPLQLNRLYNVKLHVLKSSGERTYNSDNKNIYHPKFAWYAERSSVVDINPKSYHLIAFELVNPLLCIIFQALNIEFFLKDLKSTLPSSVAL